MHRLWADHLERTSKDRSPAISRYAVALVTRHEVRSHGSPSADHLDRTFMQKRRSREVLFLWAAFLVFPGYDCEIILSDPACLVGFPN